MIGTLSQDLYAERRRLQRRVRVREVLFGALDGLVEPLGVVSGVAGATSSSAVVALAGIATGLAGALSMAAGGYLAAKAQSEVHAAAMHAERREVSLAPEEASEEMEQLLQREGLLPQDAHTVVAALQKHDEVLWRTMVEKELGIPVEASSPPLTEAVLMGASYLVASVLPVSPYLFLPAPQAWIGSLVLSLIAMGLLGILKGAATGLKLVPAVAQVMALGILAGVGGYLLGRVLPGVLAQLFGLEMPPL